MSFFLILYTTLPTFTTFTTLLPTLIMNTSIPDFLSYIKNNDKTDRVFTIGLSLRHTRKNAEFQLVLDKMIQNNNSIETIISKNKFLLPKYDKNNYGTKKLWTKISTFYAEYAKKNIHIFIGPKFNKNSFFFNSEFKQLLKHEKLLYWIYIHEDIARSPILYASMQSLFKEFSFDLSSRNPRIKIKLFSSSAPSDN